MAVGSSVSEGGDKGISVEELRASLGPDAEGFVKKLREVVYRRDQAEGTPVAGDLPESGEVREALARVVAWIREGEMPVDGMLGSMLDCHPKLAKVLRKYATSKGLKAVNADCARAFLAEPFSNLLDDLLGMQGDVFALFRYTRPLGQGRCSMSPRRDSELVGEEILSLMVDGKCKVGVNIACIVADRVGSDFSGEVAIPKIDIAFGYAGFSLVNGEWLEGIELALEQMARVQLEQMARVQGKTVEVSAELANGTLVVSFSERAAAQEIVDEAGDES